MEGQLKFSKEQLHSGQGLLRDNRVSTRRRKKRETKKREIIAKDFEVFVGKKTETVDFDFKIYNNVDKTSTSPKYRYLLSLI